MNDNWKAQAATYLTPKCITHEVNGNRLDFYPISLGLLASLRGVVRPLAQAIGSLFSDSSADYGRTMRDITFPGEDEIRNQETIIDPISKDIAEMRANQKERAIDRLVEAFTDDANRTVVARLIMDSCRDEFPRKPSTQDLEEFAGLLDLTSVAQFLVGVGKANAEAFGPLGGKVSEKLEASLKETESGSDGQDASGPSTTSPTSTESPTPPAAPNFPFPAKTTAETAPGN